MHEDIFNTNIDILKSTYKTSPDSLAQRIISLLGIKSPLTIKQIRAGLYHKYGISPDRTVVQATVTKYTERGKITRTGRALYSNTDGDIHG